MTTRRLFSFLPTILCGLALGASTLLAGCAGNSQTGGNLGLSSNGNTGSTNTGSTNTGSTNTGTNSGGTTVSPFAGNYQGVYLITSGPYAPGAGTSSFAVSSTGVVTGANYASTGDKSTNPFTATISGTGALVTNTGVSENLSQNSTTHVFSTSVTESNGTKGMVFVGLAPTASPLAGSYSGTVTGSSGQFPMTLTISSGGAVTGTVGNPAVANQGFNFVGYVDASGNLYTAETSGGVPEIIVAGLALNGTSLTATLQSSGADGSSTMGTLSLTKQ